MQAKQPQAGYTALDATGSSAVLRFYLRSGTTVAAGAAAASGLRAKIAGVSGCVLVRQSIVYPAHEPSPGAAAPGAIGYRAGVFVFGTSAADQYGLVSIPGIAPGVLQSAGAGAGILIDTTKPSVQAFIAEMTSGRWCNPFGYTLTTLITAFLQIRP